jgi:hypothetical protein
MKKELRDQALHCAAAILCLLPVALAPNILTGALSGLLAGLIREVTEEGDPVSLASILAALRSWKDLCGWALGGLIVGLVA